MQLSELLLGLVPVVRLPPINCTQRIAYWEFRHAKSEADRYRLNPGHSAPFSYCMRLTKMGKYCVVSGVVSLSNMVCPSAIVGAISKFVIDPVKGVTCWTTPHVFKEILEARRSKPPTANGNAASSVIRELLVTLSQAPLLHLAPCCIKLMSLPILKQPMSCVSNAASLGLNASTRSGVSVFHISSNSDSFLAAVANTIPFDVVRLSVMSGHHNKTPKPHTNQVNDFWHFVTSKYRHRMNMWQMAVKPLFGLQTLATRRF